VPGLPGQLSLDLRGAAAVGYGGGAVGNGQLLVPGVAGRAGCPLVRDGGPVVG
jgi:hypothetical protein